MNLLTQLQHKYQTLNKHKRGEVAKAYHKAITESGSSYNRNIFYNHFKNIHTLSIGHFNIMSRIVDEFYELHLQMTPEPQTP